MGKIATHGPPAAGRASSSEQSRLRGDDAEAASGPFHEFLGYPVHAPIPVRSGYANRYDWRSSHDARRPRRSHGPSQLQEKDRFVRCGASPDSAVRDSHNRGTPVRIASDSPPILITERLNLFLWGMILFYFHRAVSVELDVRPGRRCYRIKILTSSRYEQNGSSYGGSESSQLLVENPRKPRSIPLSPPRECTHSITLI